MKVVSNGTITIMPHPPEILDVDPKIIENLKAKLNSTGMTKEEMEASDDQDYIER